MIDTNIILIAWPKRFAYRRICDTLDKGEITMAFNSEILYEYEEQIGIRTTSEFTTNFISYLLRKNNTEFFTSFFSWNYIHNEPDDNKFVDCAIAANADYLVTNDAHFNVLKKIGFPKVEVISAKEFIALLQNT